MRETLYIRLREGSPDEDVEYAFSADDRPRNLLCRRAPLVQALALAAGRRLVLFVPAAELRLASVQVPARQPSKVLQAAPFLLEDQLADDVDALHFALGPRQADGSHPIAVVAHARITQWLSAARAQGLRPHAVYPDVLALPWDPAAPRWSALADGQQIIVRTEAFSGFSAAAEDLPLYLQLADPQRRERLRVLVVGNQAPDFTQIDWPLDLLPGYRSALEAFVQNLEPARAINLLQGEYSPRQDYQKLWKPWRLPAALATSALLVAAIDFGIETWQLQRELVELEQANLARFRALFPAEQRVVNLEAQLRQQLAGMQSSGASAGVFALLETVARAMQDNPGLTLQAMQYREGTLFLSMTGAELAVLESLREWFARQPDAALTVESADSGADGVSLRLRVAPA